MYLDGDEALTMQLQCLLPAEEVSMHAGSSIVAAAPSSCRLQEDLLKPAEPFPFYLSLHVDFLHVNLQLHSLQRHQGKNNFTYNVLFFNFMNFSCHLLVL